MTNNYIKVTTRTTRTSTELAHLCDAQAMSYIDANSNTAQQALHNLTWFFPVNDGNPQAVDGAVSQAGDLAARCKDELGRHFRGCSVSVFRDFPGNALPVIGRGE